MYPWTTSTDQSYSEHSLWSSIIFRRTNTKDLHRLDNYSLPDCWNAVTIELKCWLVHNSQHRNTNEIYCTEFPLGLCNETFGDFVTARFKCNSEVPPIPDLLFIFPENTLYGTYWRTHLNRNKPITHVWREHWRCLPLCYHLRRRFYRTTIFFFHHYLPNEHTNKLITEWNN